MTNRIVGRMKTILQNGFTEDRFLSMIPLSYADLKKKRTGLRQLKQLPKERIFLKINVNLVVIRMKKSLPRTLLGQEVDSPTKIPRTIMLQMIANTGRFFFASFLCVIDCLISCLYLHNIWLSLFSGRILQIFKIKWISTLKIFLKWILTDLA